ncbi:MAG: hypothetical protein SFV54_13945 [Bryobacteraceae bacterium]|nr:hypothetical protein [Bryobacteraceae bacterium]
MPAQLVPFVWPRAWSARAGLALLSGTPFNCAVVDGDGPPGLTGITVVTRAKAPAVVVEGEWPGVAPVKAGSAGPTGSPWVDSNGWKIRLAQAREPGRAVWVQLKTPEAGQEVNRLLAMADAAWCGARWVVDFGDDLARGLAAGNDRAKGQWERLVRAAAFFEQHCGRQALAPAARLGVLSSYAGEDEFLAEEVLNLAARRHLAYRVLVKGEALAAESLAGLQAVLYCDTAAPAKGVLAALEAFVRGGGLLLARRATVAALRGATPTGESYPRAVMYKLGRGRIAGPKHEWDDPYLLALDAHLMLSKRNDLVRLYNPGLLLPQVTSDGKRTVVQVVNFAGRGSANDVVLLVQTKFGEAVFVSLEHPEPRRLTVQREAGRTELYLPAFGIYGVVELR